MKVLHVATLMSPDAAYGGPIRVAENLGRELLLRGHDASLAASYRGYESPPESVDHLPLHLFPGRRLIPGTGFAGWSSPGLFTWATRNLKRFDLVHVHAARDLVTLPMARLALKMRRPVVLQTHGMIDASRHLLSRPLDTLWTRPTLQQANAVCYLTPREYADLVQVSAGPIRLEPLRNGVPSVANNSYSQSSNHVEVLFLARLHERKRPANFVRAASALSETYPCARFTLVGPDEGQGDAIREAIARSGKQSKIAWEGPIEPSLTRQRMAQSAIYVLPSVDEPFPMSVLEAMSVGRPVIVTNTCGIAQEILNAEAGIVVGSTQQELTSAIGKLLADEELRLRLGRNAAALALRRFSISAVVDDLLEIYERALTAASG